MKIYNQTRYESANFLMHKTYFKYTTQLLSAIAFSVKFIFLTTAIFARMTMDQHAVKLLSQTGKAEDIEIWSRSFTAMIQTKEHNISLKRLRSNAMSLQH